MGANLMGAIITLTLLDFIYTILIVLTLQHFGIGMNTLVKPTELIDSSGSVSLGFWYSATVFHPLIEEIFFRGPLAIIARKTSRFRDVLASAVILSAVFGWLHGGMQHILIQGVGGLLYCGLFLKAGGLTGRPLKGLIACSTAHMLFNMTTCIIMVLAYRHGH